MIILKCTALLLLTLEVEGQQGSFNSIGITFNKTSSVVFPAVITSVDRGSRDVLAQKAKGVENVLQLKASRQNFPETNLTVITADGKIHQFTVMYAKVPEKLIIELGTEPKTKNSTWPPPLVFSTSITKSEMYRYSKNIVNAHRSVPFKSQRKQKMGITLRSIHAKENVMFYHFRIDNASVIPYDVDYLRFYIEDKAKVKRTASQQVQLQPIYVHGNDKVFKGNSTTDLIYALEKFTIPDSKKLVIEVMERNGGRHLRLEINNKTIVRARPLP